MRSHLDIQRMDGWINLCCCNIYTNIVIFPTRSLFSSNYLKIIKNIFPGYATYDTIWTLWTLKHDTAVLLPLDIFLEDSNTHYEAISFPPLQESAGPSWSVVLHPQVWYRIDYL